jgi:hypothetical protein
MNFRIGVFVRTERKRLTSIFFESVFGHYSLDGQGNQEPARKGGTMKKLMSGLFSKLLLVMVLTVAGAPILFPGGLTKAFASPPDTPNSNTWVTDGAVYAIANMGPILYIGGGFTRIGPNTGYGASLSASTGRPMLPYSKVNGTVMVSVPDGSGGWYLGGYFTQVGDVARNNIAHILSNGTLDASWNPNADYSVWTLAVSGGTVYVGGDFSSIGGETRNYIAAIDAST